jgi:uncharacterized protein YndB with AHSA1/START domain
MANTTLRIERAYQAPAQSVFDAWTSEEVLRRWFHAEHDWETTEAEVDLRVGGVVRIVMRDPHTDLEYGGGGHYIEIEPPNRLAFTWIWDGNDTRQLIELDFDETDGITTVRFTHSGLWNEEAVRSHESGWNRCFDNLERTLEATRSERSRSVLSVRRDDLYPGTSDLLDGRVVVSGVGDQAGDFAEG